MAHRPMSGRPYAATITLRCTVAECACEHSTSALLYESKDKGQLLERQFPRQCERCGHLSRVHATVNIEKHELLERREKPRGS